MLLRNAVLTLRGEGISWAASRLVGSELVLRNDTARYSNTIIWLHSAEDHWWTILEHPRSSVSYDMIRDEALTRKLEAWLRTREPR